MKRGFKTTPKTLAWGHDFYAVQVGSLGRKLVGFRVTPKQARRIDLMARASGMTKQDYLYKRALEEEVVVRPDVRVYKMLRDEMARVPGTQAHTVRRRGRRGARLDRRLPRAGVLRHARRGGALGRRAGGRLIKSI